MSIIKVENISKTDFDHICRTCSTEGDLKPLFENIETLSMLESFTQMQFSKTDELPDKVCANCLTKINDCFQFINNCKILDENFRKCLNEPEINTEHLHSSIEIKDDEVAKPDDVIVDEEKSQEINGNVKEINVKQSEYYILQWGATSKSPENKLFQVSVVNNPSNEQDLMEKDALRRIQEAEHVRKFRKINELRRLNSPEDQQHRTRAKLTLPHEEQSVILRRNHETPEKIALRRALAREQFRRYRSKLNADEKADHRTQAAENLRKFRQKLNNQELEESRAEAREIIQRFQEPKLQKPLRLAEMAQTMLHHDPLDQKCSRFSLRPTRIPQVKKLRFDDKHWTEPPQILKFRSWTRETPKETAIRKAAALQMKKYYASLKEQKEQPCSLRINTTATVNNEDESALRRAKAAGHLRQYRPVLRKDKGVPGSNGQN